MCSCVACFSVVFTCVHVRCVFFNDFRVCVCVCVCVFMCGASVLCLVRCLCDILACSCVVRFFCVVCFSVFL